MEFNKLCDLVVMVERKNQQAARNPKLTLHQFVLQRNLTCSLRERFSTTQAGQGDAVLQMHTPSPSTSTRPASTSVLESFAQQEPLNHSLSAGAEEVARSSANFRGCHFGIESTQAVSSSVPSSCSLIPSSATISTFGLQNQRAIGTGVVIEGRVAGQNQGHIEVEQQQGNSITPPIIPKDALSVAPANAFSYMIKSGFTCRIPIAKTTMYLKTTAGTIAVSVMVTTLGHDVLQFFRNHHPHEQVEQQAHSQSQRREKRKLSSNMTPGCLDNVAAPRLSKRPHVDFSLLVSA